jgi:transcription antitermination factor NusG
MRWYVARTQPRKERYALAALEHRSVEAYVPVLRKQRPRAGRRDWEPLFAGYLFARFQVPSQGWLAARAAPGVAYFLGREGQPSGLPEDFVPAMRARLERINLAGGLPSFRSGQRVSIVQGSFQYYDAIFDRRLSPAGRSRVLVSVLTRLVPLELPEEYLRVAG